jgi:hypothetical protein
MKTYGGSGCIDLPFLTSVLVAGVWVSFMLRPLYPRGKSPRYALDRRLGGAQNRFGFCGEEKILDTSRARTETHINKWIYFFFFLS